MAIHHFVTATQEEVIEILKKTTKKLESILDSKGKDYSGKEDTFKNFKLSADLLNIPVESVIISRMGDKLSRMASLVKNGEVNVKEEAITDTIDDLVGYCILLKTYIKKKDMQRVKNDATTKHSNDGGITLFENNSGSGKYIVIDDDGEID